MPSGTPRRSLILDESCHSQHNTEYCTCLLLHVAVDATWISLFGKVRTYIHVYLHVQLVDRAEVRQDSMLIFASRVPVGSCDRLGVLHELIK